jgi:NAD(P)-dependent dehydrogenase (short-subunit alcohol dehydrogenase family)
MPGEVSYSASKGAILAASRAMAVELARRKIRVNTLSPGLVKTGMTDVAFSVLSEKHRKELEDDHPLGIGTPEDVARAAVFLLAPQNTWITGINLVIDGGYTAL